MPEVTIIIGNRKKIVAAEAGRTVMDVLGRAGIRLDAPCGGNGRCGKCRVLAEGGVSPADGRELALLGDAGAGARLACFAGITGDAVITVAEPGRAEVETRVPERAYRLDPPVRQRCVSLPRPDLLHPLDDESALKAAAGADGVSAAAVRELAEATRETRENLYVIEDGKQVTGVSVKKRKLYGMAVDIGTTTVAAYFYNLEDGREADIESGLNRQRFAGADVISRISVCMEKPDGLISLRDAMIGQLNALIRGFLTKSGVESGEIRSAVFAGNTVMLHIAAGISPANIANAPFVPATRFGGSVSARFLGLHIHPEAPVRFAPCVSSYVGGDITAGMLACSLDRARKNRLYLDIGTNGEMALLHDGRLICCSTAAGPAFEGAHIRFGTGGVPGAVCGVSLGKDGIGLATIGGEKPSGICGSGLIDAVAVMRRLRVMDETGRLCGPEEAEEPRAAGRVVEADGGTFLLDPQSGIGVTQKDVREVQLAKSAIASGIACLLHEAGLNVREVNELILAGGFGSRIHPESACAIGLIPAELEGKVRAVGNAAGAGAAQMLLSREGCRRVRKIAGLCEYIELSGNSYFQEQYIENMEF